MPMTNRLVETHGGTLAAMDKPMSVSGPMAMFLADELLPLLAANWPASANQLDGNAKGTALAFGQLLKPFSANQIREAVMALAMDADRQFAPRPAELRKACLDLAGPATAAQPVCPSGRCRCRPRPGWLLVNCRPARWMGMWINW